MSGGLAYDFAPPTSTTDAMQKHRFLVRVTFAQDAFGVPFVDGDTFLDAVEEPLFEAFQGSVTPAIRDGEGHLYCDLEGESVEEAVHRVTQTLMSIPLAPNPNVNPVRSLAFA